MATLSLELLDIVGPDPHAPCGLITLNSLIPRIKASLNKFLFGGRMPKIDIFWIDSGRFLRTVNSDGKLVRIGKTKIPWKRTDAGTCDWCHGDFKDVKYTQDGFTENSQRILQNYRSKTIFSGIFVRITTQIWTEIPEHVKTA